MSESQMNSTPELALAAKIEEVISWQPESTSGLEGTPSDPRFAYIKYDR